MKTLRNVAVVLCVAFMLTACGGGNPEVIAEKYTKAVMAVDIETAVKYATTSHAEEIKEILGDADTRDFVLNTYKGAKVKLTSSDIAEDGKSARIIFQAETAEDNEKNGVTIRVDLVKDGGDWKVDGFR